METNARARLRVSAAHRRLLRISFTDFHCQAVHVHHQRYLRHYHSVPDDEAFVSR